MLLISLMAALTAVQLPAATTQQKSIEAAIETNQPVSNGTAATLARTIAPAEVMIPLELEHARKSIMALPAVDEDAKALEHQFPGIFEAAWTALQPEVHRSIQADLPPFWLAMGQLYIKHLSESEGRTLLEF